MEIRWCVTVVVVGWLPIINQLLRVTRPISPVNPNPGDRHAGCQAKSRVAAPELSLKSLNLIYIHDVAYHQSRNQIWLSSLGVYPCPPYSISLGPLQTPRNSGRMARIWHQTPRPLVPGTACLPDSRF